MDIDKVYDKDPSGWEALLAGAAQCTALDQLLVSSVGMGPTGLRALTPLLRPPRGAQTFDPSVVQISSTAEQDAHSCTLAAGQPVLDLAESAVGPEDLAHLAAVFAAGSRLVGGVVRVDLRGNRQLAGFRLAQGSLARWDLRSRDSSLDGLRQLGRAVGGSGTVVSLDLSECELGLSAMISLVGAVDWPAQATCLKYLELGRNRAAAVERQPELFGRFCEVIGHARLGRLGKSWTSSFDFAVDYMRFHGPLSRKDAPLTRARGFSRRAVATRDRPGRAALAC